MNAVVRGDSLWTCQHVGLTGVAGVYSSDDSTGADVDRSGIQWLKLQVGTGGQSLTYAAHSRVLRTARFVPAHRDRLRDGH
jgi:hypothetical protein